MNNDNIMIVSHRKLTNCPVLSDEICFLFQGKLNVKKTNV